MPTPGEGRPTAICVGFRVNLDPVLSLLLLAAGEVLLLFSAGDVSSRALDGTASVVLARSTPGEGGVATFVSASCQAER